MRVKDGKAATAERPVDGEGRPAVHTGRAGGALAP